MTILKKSKIVFFTFLSLFFSCKSHIEQPISNASKQWIVADFVKGNTSTSHINGSPQLIDSPYGSAVSFNGVDDAFFLDDMPLKSLREFTVEMIFKPAIDGNFEQRVLHIGEVDGDRILLEIRATGNNWYLDGFAASGENKKPLIDEALIHPLGQWAHVAFVVTADNLTTFVNGKLELTSSFSFSGIANGKTSIGVRLNKNSWFKGAIYKIRITPKQLKSVNFMPFVPK